MNQAEMTKLLTVLQMHWPDLVRSPDAIPSWTAALSDVDYGVGNWAVRQWITGEKWTPTVAELRLKIAEAATGAPSVEDAAAEVDQIRAKLGHDAVLRQGMDAVFSHRAVVEAVLATGWRDLCYSDEPGLTLRQFARMYENTRQRAVRGLDLALVQLNHYGEPVLVAGGGRQVRRLAVLVDEHKRTREQDA